MTRRRDRAVTMLLAALILALLGCQRDDPDTADEATTDSTPSDGAADGTPDGTPDAPYTPPADLNNVSRLPAYNTGGGGLCEVDHPDFMPPCAWVGRWESLAMGTITHMELVTDDFVLWEYTSNADQPVIDHGFFEDSVCEGYLQDPPLKITMNVEESLIGSIEDTITFYATPNFDGIVLAAHDGMIGWKNIHDGTITPLDSVDSPLQLGQRLIVSLVFVEERGAYVQTGGLTIEGLTRNGDAIDVKFQEVVGDLCGPIIPDGLDGVSLDIFRDAINACLADPSSGINDEDVLLVREASRYSAGVLSQFIGICSVSSP